MNMINHHAAAPCLLTNAATPAMQESYNRIRVNLLARAGLGSERGTGTVCPVIGVTSVVRHRSRRYLAANLAISFARLGMRVLPAARPHPYRHCCLRCTCLAAAS